MASFDYRLNPLYTIKECSSCGALYTTDYCCSKGGLVDKIIRDPNKTPDSSQRSPQNCARCGNPVDGPYCRGCALLRKKFKEDLFTYYVENGIFQDLQDTSESSNDNTNIVNAPQEPFVVKQDPGAHYGYNCPPQVLIISNPEPCNNQTVDELPQTLPSFDPTCYSGDGNSFTYDSTPNSVNDSPNLLNFQNEIMEQMTSICDMGGQYLQKKEEDKRITEDQAAKDRYWKIPISYDDDDDDEISIPLKDIIISRLPPCVAITPILLTEEPVDSLIMEDEHLDTILKMESDEVIKSSVEDFVPISSESEGILDKMCDIDNDSFSIDDIDYVEASPLNSELVSLEEVKDFHTEDGEIEDDILREKLSKINLLIDKIEAISSNPPLSSDFVTKSSSTFPNSFLEETNTFDNSIPESETFCFDLEENSSGSTTTRSDYSLPDYEAFYFDDDHIEEKSSGSTTTHANFSQYDSFIFDISIDSFPPADRSDFYHEEFADELAHVISPPEYELTSIIDSGIRENVQSMTNVNLPFEDDQSSLLAYVVWIFLPFLTYPVTLPYLLSCGNEDTIFDPGISVYHSFMPSVFHQSGTFMKFNVYPNHLNQSSMEILSSTCSPMDQ
ncbi:hypothetical protein Tco_0289512 [Tanacetum coccineum]